MALTIRPFAEADYPVIVAVHNAVYPDYRWTEAQVRSWDATRNPEHAFGRWVCEAHGQIVGYGYYFQPPTMYDPQHLSFNIRCIRPISGKALRERSSCGRSPMRKRTETRRS